MKTENNVVQLFLLEGAMWDKIYECAKRVYSIHGIAPTVNTCGGGHREVKVLIEDSRHTKSN